MKKWEKIIRRSGLGSVRDSGKWKVESGKKVASNGSNNGQSYKRSLDSIEFPVLTESWLWV